MRASSAAQAAAGAAGAALLSAFALRGFTVDDALVTARVASHLASGQGYRFNVPGPVVDAVTPLGWAELLASFGPGTPLVMLERGRVIGLVAWIVAAAVLGVLGGGSRRRQLTVVAALLVSAPLASWASTGMETGLVTLFATLALAGGPVGALAAGLAAAWRPELLAWAAVLVAGDAFIQASDPKSRSRALSVRLPLALGPAIAVACVRHARFGSFAPLAVWAKPSDLAHGFVYALGAGVGTGAAPVLLAPRAFARADRKTQVLVLSVAAHWVALVLVGGDWMALYRLAVPVLPAAILAAAGLLEVSTRRALAARALVTVAVPLWILATVAWPGRYVLGHRLALIEASRGALLGARSVACLDVGWVGAATDVPILDLAGITDPLVAYLPGGHTTKRIDNDLFERRGVDAVVLLLAPGARLERPWERSEFARGVEERVASLPAVRPFRVKALLPLGGTRQSYLVARPEIGRFVVRPPPAPAISPQASALALRGR
ncbi:MAG TPA: hypothetical protein VMI54_17065 [Polyangiaceae bacterium]|nr:hypothetical protein [Polyangiaceae bacterium]